MPCYDDRDEQARESLCRHSDAKTAIICGLLKKDTVAKIFAESWYEHHSEVDRLRACVQYDWQDPRIAIAHDRAREVLDRAYESLCSKPMAGG